MRPAPIWPTIMPAVTRKPRTQGLPPMTSARCVIRSNVAMPLFHRHQRIKVAFSSEKCLNAISNAVVGVIGVAGTEHFSADSRRRSHHRHASRRDALFHDYSRGGAACFSGGLHGARRRRGRAVIWHQRIGHRSPDDHACDGTCAAVGAGGCVAAGHADRAACV